ncbi:prepilin-type N-terminal cleavage/methylation domain-containing protein [Acinetobacter indicus]|uniref:prepilin-type N-terminal cleavage/methylation domain-containing protein n=1 Tax=Acinetobacter indicus TaxID=756892 RepID=UPI000CEBE984|nr:prepilin-type N-terminal cleavage/methylation domain-containing protein [Acinetobacter indicus]QIC75942.1 prepilin-type N-terminal cleavage/methylation domain-containing protein [Acinetobacter indicus]
MTRSHHFSSVRGFTLIELMVVIVVMAIAASLVLMNIGGVDQRSAMQAREVFLMDVKKLQREADDQSRVLALNVQNANDVSPFRYEVLEYLPATTATDSSSVMLSQTATRWQKYAEFEMQSLPDGVSFQIQPLQHGFENAQNAALLQGDAPKLIWLGNGEVKPVRIQFYFEQRPVGAEIEIDHLGKIVNEE